MVGRTRAHDVKTLLRFLDMLVFAAPKAEARTWPYLPYQGGRKQNTPYS